MVLTEDDKAHVKAVWAQIQSTAPDIFAEALFRLFLAHTPTKTYFAHFDLSAGSADIKGHGKKLAAAIGDAVSHLDDIAGALSKLSDLHAQKLRVDPVNFGFLIHCILVTIAVHFPNVVNPSILVSVDKFLCRVGAVLTAKYR
uniref:Globin domain-containing protein n=1 Tax=Salvator merianae TaxID=96440 RepID=A0A8D0BI09_SALMN